MDQPEFITRNLDISLLSANERVRTNWQVISGAPCSGKTTLINLMAEKGFKTVPEAARLYLDRGIAKGQTLAGMRKDLVALQWELLRAQIDLEMTLHPGDLLFLDTAIPNYFSFCRVFGIDPNDMLPACPDHRYASVFILDRLPLELDGLRYETDAIPHFLDQWLVHDYRALGYTVVRVPVMPVAERLAFILERLPERGVNQVR